MPNSSRPSSQFLQARRRRPEVGRQFVSASLALSLLACGSAGGTSGAAANERPAASAGAAGAAGAGGAGSVPQAGSAGAATSAGGGAGKAGSGGGITGSGSASSGPVGDACAGVVAKADAKVLPADIVWAIDTSGSMSEESTFVQQKLNAFAQGILGTGIDVRVVMVAAEYGCPLAGWCPPLPIEGLCIVPPLGSGQCPKDHNPPLYVHEPTVVSSTNGLKVLLSTFPKWKSFLRPEATKTLIVVTDDDGTDSPYQPSEFPDGAKGAAKKFITDFTAQDPKLLAGWKMSGIYSFTKCASAAAAGTVWEELVTQTGGVKGDLCTQDFQPIFNDLAKGIVSGAKLPCTWKIPAPPPGEVFDPSKVNVHFTSGAGAATDFLYVPSEKACDPKDGGWYYDDPQKPGAVLACPATCSKIQADASGTIAVQFGCATKVAEPH